MKDFRLVKTEKDFLKIKEEIKLRGGVNEVQINNEPKNYPIVLTYSLSNTINGIVANLKHITTREITKLINEK